MLSERLAEVLEQFKYDLFSLPEFEMASEVAKLPLKFQVIASLSGSYEGSWSFSCLIKQCFFEYIAESSWKNILYGARSSAIRQEDLSRRARIELRDFSIEAQVKLLDKVAGAFCSINSILKISSPIPSSSPGVAITHRVWLGSFPDEGLFRSVCASDKKIAEHWKKSCAEVGQIEHILWTSNIQLLNGSYDHIAKLSHLKIRSVDSLLDQACLRFPECKHLVVFVRALILQNEYAEACNIIRAIILYLYGGFYIDFSVLQIPPVAIDGRPITTDGFKEKITPFSPVASSIYLPFVCGSGLRQQYMEPKQIADGFRHMLSGFSNSEVKRYPFLENTMMYVGERHSDFSARQLDFMLQAMSSEELYKSKGVVANYRREIMGDSFDLSLPDLHFTFDIFPLHFALWNTLRVNVSKDSKGEMDISYSDLQFGLHRSIPLEFHLYASGSDPKSYHCYMKQGLFKKINNSWASKDMVKNLRSIEW